MYDIVYTCREGSNYWLILPPCFIPWSILCRLFVFLNAKIPQKFGQKSIVDLWSVHNMHTDMYSSCESVYSYRCVHLIMVNSVLTPAYYAQFLPISYSYMLLSNTQKLPIMLMTTAIMPQFVCVTGFEKSRLPCTIIIEILILII